MKIAIDQTPLVDKSSMAHRVRGTGFYIKNLEKSLLEYYSNNKYTFFTRGEALPNDISLVHFPYFEPFFVTLPVVKKHTTVVTVHDLTPLVFPKEFPYGYKGLFKWWIQKISLKRVDAIIADSECSRQDIIRLVKIPEEKVFTVYLAASEEFSVIDDKTKFLHIRKKYNLPEKFALYVGDVTWNKNLPRLLRAVEEARIPLVMVGKALVNKKFDKNNFWNKDLVTVQEIAEKNSLIVIVGFVPTEDLVLLYNMAEVFVMPSLYEGFGLPILEAMQCGCPVVATKEGSIPEVVEDAGIYVDAYNVTKIAKGIKKVFLESDLRKKLSLLGQAQAKKFSWKKTATDTMRVYESVGRNEK